MSWLGRAAWVAVGAAGARVFSDPDTKKKLRELGREVRAAVKQKAQDLVEYIEVLDSEDARKTAAERQNAPTESPKQARNKPNSSRGRRKPAGATT